MTDVQLQPDEAAVLQEEAPAVPLTTVPTYVEKIVAPVRVKVLPLLPGGTRTRAMPADPVRLLTADRFRARVTVVANAAFYWAWLEVGASDQTTSAWWPASVPLVLDGAGELWVYAAGAVTAGDMISAATQRWAAGE